MKTNDYIKVRVTEEDRAVLQELIQQGSATSLSAATHHLAFEQSAPIRKQDAVASILAESAAMHADIRKLIFCQLDNKTLYEPDLIRMEQMISQICKETALLSKVLRKEG